MGSAKDCPSLKAGLCKVGKKCYAMKAEKIYSNVLPYRERQAEYWVSVTPQQFCDDFHKVNSRKRVKMDKLRFNESGDFYSQDCVDKAELIAYRLFKDYGIKTYTYTARRDLDFSQCEYLTVNGSGFMPNSEKANSFTAVKKDVIGEAVDNGYISCIGDCKKCSICADRSGQKIVVAYH